MLVRIDLDLEESSPGTLKADVIVYLQELISDGNLSFEVVEESTGSLTSANKSV